MMRTLEDIDREMRDLEAQRDELKHKLRELQKERDLVVCKAEVDAMPEAKRRAMAQVISPTGISSATEFGMLGAKRQ